MKIIIGRFSYSRNDLGSYNKDNLLILGLVLIGLMIIFSYGIGNVSAASSNSIYVNSSSGNDAYNGLNSTWIGGLNGPKATIKNATGTVTTNGTVHIAQGTYNESNIQINTDMAIIGENQNNTIINGKQSGKSIFTIATGINLTLINLTLTNVTSTRGAVLNYGTLTVNNSTFTNNSPTQNIQSHGGVICNYGTLAVNNSIFTDNTATFGGVIFIYSGTMTVINSTFTNNTADYGGTIDNYGDTLTVINSTFTDNTAGYGGAIDNYGDTLTVINSTFTNNTANDGSGGAILCSHTLTVNNCTFANNTASSYGGAISSLGPLTVNNSTFTNNTAKYGGAITSSVNLTVNNNIFTNNSASSYGGAIANYGTGVVNFNRIIGNTAPTSSAIYNSSGTLDARYNWWGSNTNPSANISGSGVTYSPWIVLTVISNPTTIDVDGKSTITVDLLNDSDGVYHDPVNGHVPDGLTVIFSCDTKGIVNSLNSTIINGSTDTIFTGLKPGVSQLSTNVDAQTVPTNININKLPTKITINPISGYKGDVVNLKANLTDTHSNVPLSGKTVQFSVNGNVVGRAVTDDNGIATLSYTIQEISGFYTIKAEYTDDTNTYDPTSNTNTLTVTKTPTTITVNPIGGYKGDIVNLNANLTDTHSNVPLSGKIVQFSVNGNVLGTGVTDSNGIATLSYTIQEISGFYSIKAEYTDDTDTYDSSSNTNILTVTKTPTAITVNPIGGYKGDIVNLTANLTDTHSNVPLIGKIVQFSVNSNVLGTGVTDSNGIATLSYTIQDKSGTYSIKAEYIDDTNTYDPTSNTNILTVTKTPTAITINPISGYRGDKTNLTANLTDTHSNVPLSGKTVQFSVNGNVVGTALTDSNGIATLSYTIQDKSGTYSIKAEYIDDTNTYDPTSNTNTLTVTKTPTAITVNPIGGYKGDIVNLTANLTDTHSNVPLIGKIVQFSVNGNVVGTALTDSNGIAILSYTIQEISGFYSIKAEYADGTNTYDPTTNTNTLTVTSTPTDIVVNPISGYKGDKINLTANLTDTHSNVPLIGKIVQFSVDGNVVGTALTDSNGIATISYPIQENSGFYTILAEFTGDSTYTNSSNTNTLKVTNIPTAKASPNGGLYNTTKSVTLTMNEPGKIYYTTNGTTPTNTSKLYTGPLTIKSTTTLKYLAADLMGNQSTIYSATYTIDKTAPKVTANVKSGLYNTTKTVKLTMNENGTIYYTINGTTPTINSKKYGGPISIKSTTKLKYLAIDLAGNKSPIYTATYTIDKTAPKVISTKPKNNSKGVSLTTSIVIKFKEKINKTTNFSKIYIKNLSTGKITHTTTKLSGNTITIKMIRSRLSLDHYQVYIPTKAVKDTAGNTNTKYVLNFKTSKY